MASNFGSAVITLVVDREPARAELLGTYSYIASWGNTSLELKSDGTFRQAISEVGHTPRTITGKWISQSSMNSVEVHLTPFGMIWDEDHERVIDSCRMDFYKPRLGQAYGVIDEDLGEQYKREH